MIVEAGQQLKCPPGCCLHRICILMGRYAASDSIVVDDDAATAAAATSSATDIGCADTSVSNADTTVNTIANGDTYSIGPGVPHRWYFLPF